MAFDLKRVLKVMLFASNGPLAVKDIQTAFTRFHEQAESLPFEGEPEAEAAPATEGEGAPAAEAEAAAPAETPAAEAAEAVVPPAEEDEVYRDVPSLITTAQIREAMEEISRELQAGNSEVLLVESHSGWRLVTHPRYARWVRLLRNEPPPVRLTASAIETLAVIAYRQPTTRAEIEQIRGVSAEAGLAKLLERDLIYVVGRADLPGRPTQFGTTDAFLEFVGIKSLDELPASDVLSPRQIDAWLNTSNNPRPASDGDMGLDETQPSQMTLDQAPVVAADGGGEAPAAEEPKVEG
ncbi:SMC-Scp complex subunit ScpB [Oleiharenicola sp. Vm1]|uniref:SMC-Scp complex subunit ScpB n=1 Tax=Oleiharenicola sp. Vm1 TaxID=3398393 RepID=UPI0039F5E983